MATEGSLLEPHHDGSPLFVSNHDAGARRHTCVCASASRTSSAPSPRCAPGRTPTTSRVSPSPRRSSTLDGWDWWEAEIEVENPVHGYRFLIKMGDGRNLWVNGTGVHTIETLDTEDFKLITYPPAPEWSASSVMYQIFPDRFARSREADARTLPEWAEPAKWSDPVIHIGPSTATQFYGGDLLGIEEHLDHLERLGVNLVYLTPVFPARSNHRYDALSFEEIDPLLGGDAAYVVTDRGRARARHARHR